LTNAHRYTSKNNDSSLKKDRTSPVYTILSEKIPPSVSRRSAKELLLFMARTTIIRCYRI
jgi:hypothetical protein